MTEMKEFHQQDLAKMKDTYHKDMATVGDKLELLTKLVIQQRSHEMHSLDMYPLAYFSLFGVSLLN